MTEHDDLKYMKRCLELAVKGEGKTYPNPMVGSVIVHGGRIIGEGYHLRSGEPHAEVIAINSVEDKSLLKKATLYVNLEPCSHFGITPPCADLIISYSIPRVVIGSIDTNEKVSGQGSSNLKDAGCTVITGIAEADCRRLNKRFFTFHEKKRPYITLKWAQSSDGFIDFLRSAGDNAGTNWITGRAEKVLVHKWRASEQAILIGAATYRNDNPRLNVREWTGANPLRLILSSSGELDIKNIENEINGTTIVYTHNRAARFDNAEKVILHPGSSSASQILESLYKMGIQSLFIEGGAKILDHFIAEGFWDEARVFTGTKVFKMGIKAPSIGIESNTHTVFKGSHLDIYFNELS